MFKFVGVTVLTAVLLITVVAIAGSIYSHLNPALAASPAAKAQAASENEAESRKGVAAEVNDVKAALDSMQTHMETGDVTNAKADAKRLRDEFGELSEMCTRWDTDLNRLATDGRNMFDEWTTLIDSIQDPARRVKQAERLARARAKFHENFQQAEAALHLVREALVAYGDVDKIIKSAMEFAPKAEGIAEGLAALSNSARERTIALKSATNAVLAAVDKLEGSLLS